MEAALGPVLAMTVVVPQIQFLDDGMVGISGLGAWFNSGYMVCVSSWALLDGFPYSPRTWKLDTTFTSPSYLAVPVRCLVYSSWRNAWFYNGYMLRVSSWCLWKVFFVKENSNLEVDSRLLSWGLLVWRSAHSFCFGLLGLLHFEIWTLFPRASRIWQSVFRRMNFASEEFFPVFDSPSGEPNKHSGYS